MILITGAAGFIGSALTWYLNELGIEDIIISDKLHSEDKWLNIRKRSYYDWVDRDELFEWLEKKEVKINVVVHLGACSATTEKNGDFLLKNNYEYTKKLWNYCTRNDINYIYASSAATYGDGENGYDDDIYKIEKLLPLNKYGYSKHIFDLWALKQKETPKQWVGLKFFNVYGPNEYHKERMASVVYHAYNQALKDKEVKLFKSYKEEYKDGYQLRDFVYIKDVVKIIHFFIETEGKSGIYNVGTGQADSFYNLAFSTMTSMGIIPIIKFVDMPDDLKNKYQYFTEAKMSKLREVGYKEKLYSLSEGVKDYVQNYLLKEDKYL